MKPELKLGGIYKTEFDERPYRIIGLDNYEVFYDCLWSNEKWTFSGNFRGKSIFYRMSHDLFHSKSELTEIKELSEIEYKFFRPDLPMRFGRTKEISWNKIDLNGQKFIKETFLDTKLNTDRIIIVPYGIKGSHQKGIEIENKKGLTIIEVIKEANQIQTTINRTESNGIGFYRLGYEKGLPRYLIGEYLDRAGILKE